MYVGDRDSDLAWKKKKHFEIVLKKKKSKYVLFILTLFELHLDTNVITEVNVQTAHFNLFMTMTVTFLT